MSEAVMGLEKFLNKFGGALKRFGLPEGLFARLASAYFIVSSVSVMLSRLAGVNPVSAWKDYVAKTFLPALAAWAAVLFLWITFAVRFLGKRVEKLDFTVLGISAVIFSLTAVWCSGSFYFGAAAALVCAVFLCYSLGKLPPGAAERLDGRIAAATVAAISLLAFLFTAVTTVVNHRNFGTSCFDMGIFVQTFHSLRENLSAVITCERDMAMSHFRVHTSFIFYLFLPVYAIFPYPETLLIGQAFFAMAGVLPLYLIAKRHGFKGWALVSACALYAFCGGLIMPCYYSFHENAFLPTLLMWLLWAADCGNIPVFYIMSALVCIVKEDAPLYVFCAALWFVTEQKGRRRIHGAVSAALSAAYFAVVMHWLNSAGDGGYMTASRFGPLLSSPGGGIAEIVKNSLADPAYLVSLLLTKDTLLFFCETLLPLLMLPLITKKINRFLLALPYAIMNLIVGAGYAYAGQIGFQYIFGPVCLLIYLAVVNAADMPAKIKNAAIICAAAVTAVTTVSLASQKLSVLKNRSERGEFFDSAEECLRDIPKEGSVLANTFILPHIADRAEIYELDDGVLIKDGLGNVTGIKEQELYDYIVLSRLDPLTDELAPYLESEGRTVFDESDGFIVVYS